MLYIPTRGDIESLKEGDMALNCFGRKAEVVGEVIKVNDINGKLFAHYYTASASGNGRISMSMKEDKLVRHVSTSAKFNSHQLDLIEADMLAKGERAREL